VPDFFPSISHISSIPPVFYNDQNDTGAKQRPFSKSGSAERKERARKRYEAAVRYSSTCS